MTRSTILMNMLLLVPVSMALQAAEGPAKLNVLFIAVDDLRTEFGAYGKSYIHSPNLDRLARRGVTFQRAYCQQAVCSPSRSSLLTGTRPDTTKVWDLQTHFRVALPDVVTLPQHFKQHGYFVQGMGKLFHGGFDDPRSWSVPWKASTSSGGSSEKGLRWNILNIAMAVEADWRRASAGSSSATAPTLTKLYGSSRKRDGRKFSR